MVRPELWLGDLARAVSAMRPRDRETMTAIAEALGVELPAVAPAAERETARPGQRPDPSREIRRRRMDIEPPGAAAAPATPERQLPVLTPVDSDASGLRQRWVTAEPLEEFSPDRHQGFIEHHEPLLDRRWARQVVGSLLATSRLDGPIDEPAVVDAVARGQPVDPVPRLIRRSLSRGAQVLVDVSEGMQPFIRDAWHLADEIEAVTGSSNVETLSFADSPTRGAGSGPVWTWGDYVPPDPGRPVIVVTDLGIGGPTPRPERSRESEWLELVSQVGSAGSRLVAFVPYPRERWRPGLAKAMTIVEWDRSTTVATVHALREDAA
jgi:hypothetical protein